MQESTPKKILLGRTDFVSAGIWCKSRTYPKRGRFFKYLLKVMLNCVIIVLLLSVLSFVAFGYKEGGQMSTAIDVIKKAIEEEKGIRIFLTHTKEFDGAIPVRIKFVGNYFRLKETDSHNKDELVLEVNSRSEPHKVAWPSGKPKMRVEIENILEGLEFWDNHFKVYAYLADGVYYCWKEVGTQLRKEEVVKELSKGKTVPVMYEW